MPDVTRTPAEREIHRSGGGGAAVRIPEPHAAEGIVETVKEKAKDLAAGASDMAGKAKDTVQGWASSVGDAAVHAKDKAQEMAGAAAEQMGDWGKDFTNLVRRHPVPSLLVAFGLGFLAAQAVRRI